MVGPSTISLRYTFTDHSHRLGYPQQQFQGSEGPTDYTRQWIDYYHAIGDFQQAEALREGLRQGEMMLFQRSGAGGFA